jgi:acyl carrier protein
MQDIRGEIQEYLKTQGFLDRQKSLNDHESLTETGVIDSIGLLQLVDFLERTYKIEIPMEIITPENFDTLSGISLSIMKFKKG